MGRQPQFKGQLKEVPNRIRAVIDLYSRRLIGYSMAEHMRADLAVDALRHAVAARGGQVDGVIFHADYAEVFVEPRNPDLAWAA